MISRRDALKLGAASIAATSLGIPASPAGHHAVAQEQSDGVPMWRGNAARTGVMRGPAPGMDTPIYVKWRFATGGEIVTSPAIHDGTVYIGSMDGTFHAIDAETGEERWHLATGAAISSSPTVSGTTVYVGNDVGEVYALDARSGEVTWTMSLDRSWTGSTHAALSPVVDNGIVYISDALSTLYAINATTGTVLWRYNSLNVRSSPAVFEGVVFVGTSSGVEALDARTGAQHASYGTSLAEAKTPAVFPDTIYTTEYGEVRSYSRATEEEVWSYFTGNLGHGIGTPPTVTDDSVYAGYTRGMVAIDRIAGTELWRMETSEYVGTIAAVDGFLFAGGGDAQLFSVDAATGRVHWTFTAGDDVMPPVVVDRTIYFGSHDGVVYAIGTLEDKIPILAEETILRAAPSVTGVERGTLSAGIEISLFDIREERDGIMWVEISVDDTTGWIHLDTIDPATLPPEGEIDYVYQP